jgi:hypothetical protein
VEPTVARSPRTIVRHLQREMPKAFGYKRLKLDQGDLEVLVAFILKLWDNLFTFFPTQALVPTPKMREFFSNSLPFFTKIALPVVDDRGVHSNSIACRYKFSS